MPQIHHIRLSTFQLPWGCGLRVKGYHFLILNGVPAFAELAQARYLPLFDGAIECAGFVDGAEILIALIGANPTPAQHFSLLKLLADLISIYDVSVDSICGADGIDIEKILRDLICWRNITQKEVAHDK